jgi:hypothetical protein
LFKSLSALNISKYVQYQQFGEEEAMKWTTAVILAVGCIIAWPIAKEAAIDKLVSRYMKESGVSEKLNKDGSGAIGNVLMFTASKAMAYSVFDQQDIGTQVVAVFRALVLDDIPPIKSE